MCDIKYTDIRAVGTQGEDRKRYTKHIWRVNGEKLPKLNVSHKCIASRASTYS